MKRFINCAFKIIFSRTLFIILMILVVVIIVDGLSEAIRRRLA